MMAREPSLAGERDSVRTLQLVLRDRLPPQPPPPALLARIEAAIRWGELGYFWVHRGCLKAPIASRSRR
jgi:hypothetical protein